ncbi:hypothetical protein V2G26_019349 [Clonostachys chloroleuca]
MAPKSILVTGASGYIGGTFLATFLDGNNEWVNHYQVSVLVRTKGQADFARANNITPALFETFDDSELLTRIGQDFDTMSSPGVHLSVAVLFSNRSSTVIVHTGQGWHPTAATSLFSGQEKRQRDLERKVHFLSISGTSNFSDRPVTGKFIDNRVKSDEEDMYSREKYRRGEFNKFTFQLPVMVQAAKKCSSVAMIGEGTSIENHVHVEDIASLLNTLLARIHDGQEIRGKRGIYFCESGEHTSRSYAQALATVLKERGVIESDEVKSLDLQAVADLCMPGLPLTLVELPFAGNSRTKAVLGRKVGWSPKHTGSWTINLGQEVDDYWRL